MRWNPLFIRDWRFFEILVCLRSTVKAHLEGVECVTLKLQAMVFSEARPGDGGLGPSVWGLKEAAELGSKRGQRDKKSDPVIPIQKDQSENHLEPL